MENKNGMEVQEILWSICLKARHFIDKLESAGAVPDNLQKDFQELMNSFEPLLKEKKFIQYMGEFYFQKEQYDRALEFYSSLEEDENGEILIRIADILLFSGEYEKAGEKLDRLIELNEENPVAWFKKGNLYYEMDTEMDNAIFYLEKALELKSDYIDALVLMSKAWMERARQKKDKFIKIRMQKEALSYLDSAMKFNENTLSPDKEYNLARIFAIKSFLDPDNSDDYKKNSLDLLGKSLDVDESKKEIILEKIRREAVFGELGLVIESPDTTAEELEDGEEYIESGELPLDEKDDFSELIQLAGGDLEVKSEKEKNEAETKEENEQEFDFFKKAASMSPTEMMEDGKKKIKERKNKKKNKKSSPEKIEVLRPDELGL